jgi:mono/diheme cytochrome c family protein
MRLALLLVLAALVLPSPALAQDPVARGADIYIRKGCLGCHGASGRGGVGPQLARTSLTLDAS